MKLLNIYILDFISLRLIIDKCQLLVVNYRIFFATNNQHLTIISRKI